MPSVLSEYIQDFIRPRKPVTDDIEVIYDYFVELEQKLCLRFQFKVGMLLHIKNRSYKIIKTSENYVTLIGDKGVVRVYKKNTINIRVIVDKTIFIKRYIRTLNMVKLIWSYLCEGKDPFHKMIILKKYKKFWTSYI